MADCLLGDRNQLWQMLESTNLGAWARDLRQQGDKWFTPAAHGTMQKWLNAYQQLPNRNQSEIKIEGDFVTISDSGGSLDEDVALRKTLMDFHPWRKGPFRIFGVEIDTEWRSNLKWDRIAEQVEFKDKTVLDVGCGNGYYGWRMLNAGARFVLGCEPFLLYAMQFEVIRKYARANDAQFVLPLGDTDLPSRMAAFDLALSMGVLYHRPNPIDHLQRMRSTLSRDGQLVLETIVLDQSGQQVLTPESRYAKMRNVWFIPTAELLSTWLRRSGFRDVKLLDVSRTTIHEQRPTEWMTFESLVDFLDPNDHSRTIEGHPAPVRAIITARPR
ncbi:MAG: tRNA 5-methoxyuridine(34)/uridine 5-oxyacetic acid(34) synthase CmoB [Aureliella sp.]